MSSLHERDRERLNKWWESVIQNFAVQIFCLCVVVFLQKIFFCQYQYPLLYWMSLTISFCIHPLHLCTFTGNSISSHRSTCTCTCMLLHVCLTLVKDSVFSFTDIWLVYFTAPLFIFYLLLFYLLIFHF